MEMMSALERFDCILKLLPPMYCRYKVGIAGQFRAVLWRSWKACIREPMITKMRISQSIVS